MIKFFDLTKIKHLFSGYVFSVRSSGLIRGLKDKRDFETSVLGWGEYKPLHSKLSIPSLSIKNQGEKNNCQFQATAGQKENDEGVVLSARSLSAYGKKNGMTTGNGFSSIQSGQKALKNWGICEEKDIGGEDIDGWDIYVDLDITSLADLASEHKTKTYWSVDSRGDRLKCLDDGKQITTGIDWYTAYNQGGGFQSPWIIDKTSGWKIGGHALRITGYDMNYFGVKVYELTNSYGKNWGDNGKLYIDMDFFDKNNYGCYVNLDIPKEDAISINASNSSIKNTFVISFVKSLLDKCIHM